MHYDREEIIITSPLVPKKTSFNNGRKGKKIGERKKKKIEERRRKEKRVHECGKNP